MKKSCYEVFNDDFKKRIEFQSKLFDWENFGLEVSSDERISSPNKPSIILDPNQDNFLQLHAHMENVFFPLIDMKQHARVNNNEDTVVRDQLNEMVNMVFIELLTLNDIMRTFKDPKLFKSTASKQATPFRDILDPEGTVEGTQREMILEPEESEHSGEATYLNDYQRWVIGRLMKRLLN